MLQLLARHRLSLIESQNFTLTNSTFVRAHIDNRRAVRAVLQGLGNEVTLRTGQPNYLYLTAQGQSAAQPETAEANPRGRDRGGDPGRRRSGAIRARQAPHR